MTTQTKIIVATAAVLAVVDIAVRAFLPTRTVVVHEMSAVPANTNASVLTVRQLRIVDDSGEVKMDMKVNSQGNPGILMFDSSGTERLQLDTFQDIPSLILMDSNENRRVYFGMESGSGSGTYQNYDEGNAVAHDRNDD
ncbi:MAG: hypothetical protein NTX57_03160 [Armatimonadetes bacterium]|nr:hypothetical protein [Armatimonadota bacterium]